MMDNNTSATQASTSQQSQTKTQNSATSSNAQRKPNTRPSSHQQHKIGKGKSKYAKKARGNAKKAPVAKPKGPVNSYTSKCCNAPAVKKACVAVSKKDALEQSLGKWRCSACKKRCTVTVSKAAPERVTSTSPTGAKVSALVTEAADMGTGIGEVPSAG